MRQALEQVKSALLGASQGLQRAGAAAEAGILEAQALMLEDPAVLEAAFALLGQGVPGHRPRPATGRRPDPTGRFAGRHPFANCCPKNYL